VALRPSRSPGDSRWAPWVGLVARLAVGTTFLVAGVLKIADPDAAARAVQAYRLMPAGLGELLGYGLPFLEVGVALLLLVGFATRAAATVLGLLLVAFIGGIASAWARGLSIDCGCFGGGGAVGQDQTQYVQELLRDGALLVGAAWLVVWPRTRLSLDAVLGMPAAYGPDLDDEPEEPDADEPAVPATDGEGGRG